jgi:hypothetical protein
MALYEDLVVGNLTITGTVSGTTPPSLGTITSAQLATALSDETGTGVAVFGTAPTISAPVLTGKVTLGTATSGKLLGSGATGANAALGTTAGNALEFYLNATHTTGDMRGEYLRLYFSGIGGSGEALRAVGTINGVSVAAGGTVNGAHISLTSAGAGSKVTGAANALRVTFGAGALVDTGGTCSTIQVDTDFAADATVPPNFAFLRFTNSNTLLSGNLMRIPNVTAAPGLLAAHVTEGMTHSIKIVSEDGTPYYIMCASAATNRT